MKIMHNGRIDEHFQWFNEPRHTVADGTLVLTTAPDTDFWQKTHYGFQRDNGHCLLRAVADDFMMSVKTEFAPRMQYDQCGLIVRADSGHWIKTSTEFETEEHSRLGSVVTNLGYSDWATIDLSGKIDRMWYRIQSKNHLKDFLIESSADGVSWRQLRIAHLHAEATELRVGIYACSPMESSFDARFSDFELDGFRWS